MRKIGWMLVAICCLVGCRSTHFTEINPHQDFVATVNILQPSLSFFDEQGAELATWSFDEAYTGAVLIQQDRVLMYGHELAEAHIYELSTGEKMATIDCGIGTTNAYYDKNSALFFMTNSQTNAVTSYDLQAAEVATQQLYNYPMSMAVSNDQLYVVNYKDTQMSVLDTKTLQVVDEWPIEHSSHGIVIVGDEIWIGGHGQGSKANETIDVYDRHTGQAIKQLNVPLMPVGFSQQEDKIAVVSHGDSMLYELTPKGDIASKMKISANPFAVQYFAQQLVIAGYDDQTLYFIENGQLIRHVTTKKGPFQLLVRESNK